MTIENYESTSRHCHRRQTHLNWLATRLGHGNRLGVLALDEPIVGYFPRSLARLFVGFVQRKPPRITRSIDLTVFENHVDAGGVPLAFVRPIL